MRMLMLMLMLVLMIDVDAAVGAAVGADADTIIDKMCKVCMRAMALKRSSSLRPNDSGKTLESWQLLEVRAK